ncbi:MAG: diguanylate cyclase [Anaerolineales bacterium]|nr:diguanylate cyclase [Anaerolineales bacterium]
MSERDIFYREILENLADGVYFVDRQRKITFWNKGAERISGYAKDEVVGYSCADNILMHVDGSGKVLCLDGCPLAATMQDGKMREAEVFLHHANGHRVPVAVRATPIYGEDGEIIGAVELFSDQSSRATLMEQMQEMKKAALLDGLTQVGNRKYMDMKLESIFNEWARHQLPFGVLFIDIDHFKLVNDTYGHANGDRALKMVGDTLANNIRFYDFLARWGGEEFIVLLQGVDEKRLSEIAEKLRTLIAKSEWESDEGVAINVTVSIGCTLVRQGDNPESIIARADQLLYQSKQTGRNKSSIG